ncbi:MAG: hypothetical protein AAGD13_08375 [Pseudomonadota bacterium]
MSEKKEPHDVNDDDLDEVAGGITSIADLNVRGGRRTDDTYGAVEYDYVPTILKTESFDVVHIQFHGSDFNAPKDDKDSGSGWDFSEKK